MEYIILFTKAYNEATGASITHRQALEFGWIETDTIMMTLEYMRNRSR